MPTDTTLEESTILVRAADLLPGDFINAERDPYIDPPDAYTGEHHAFYEYEGLVVCPVDVNDNYQVPSWLKPGPGEVVTGFTNGDVICWPADHMVRVMGRGRSFD